MNLKLPLRTREFDDLKFNMYTIKLRNRPLSYTLKEDDDDDENKTNYMYCNFDVNTGGI
jgi:hypothetical protein